MGDFKDLNTKITEHEFDMLKHSDTFELTCRVCQKLFKQTKGIIVKSFKSGYSSGFCSRSCSNKFKKNQVQTICEECGISIIIRKYSYDHDKHHFCSYSCSTKYRNRNKKTGYNRSKIEIYIENKIREDFPNLLFCPNNREILDGLELDYYFPNLKLAIELNGITHYEPIYGLDRLTRSQDSDKRKMCLCYEKGIELAVIDISAFKYFTDKFKEKIWQEVHNLLLPFVQ